MITTFYPPNSFGGDGIFVHRLSNELAQRGHQVEVIHCIDAYRLLANQTSAKIYDNHPNVTVHGLKSKFGFLSPLATHQTGFPFFKSVGIHQILAKNFDVIHYHNISLVGGIKILEYGRGIKLYTTHEYWLVCPTHVLFRFNRAACTRSHCSFCSLFYKRPPQWWRRLGLLKAVFKHVDALLAPSHFSENVHKQLGLDVPIVHLPHFVPSTETEEVAASEKMAEETPKEPYFLFVGRLEKLKGLQTLIPHFCHYRKARLLIAGNGSYESRLRRMAGGNGNIRFLGHVSSWHLQNFYRQAVAVVVPSLCFEVFPLAILEAFRQQTPVIARNLGTMPEIIGESGGGVVYDTEEDLTAKLDQFLADPSLHRILGQQGYQAYQQKWTIEKHLQQYLALIHEIAETRNRSSN
jgi:glycosyltransferase involved in cell wall biosynthesis